ncbi:MAG TPA: hypothetical protein VMV93_04895 [Chloroflexota bacterium]|nr:hypothetical protein [Chloroflexota bacterium]
MRFNHPLLTVCSALIVAAAAVPSVAAAASTPTPPAGATEVTGSIIWHERVGRDTPLANVGVLLNSNGSDILISVPKGTPMYRKFWGVSGPSELHDGDTLHAWGSASSGSASIVRAQMTQDISIQNAAAEATGQVLFRDDGFVYVQVASKPDGSPIGSVLVAERSSSLKVTLPGGLPGQWSDIRAGETVNVGGTYDSASQAMYDTDHIAIQAVVPAA